MHRPINTLLITRHDKIGDFVLTLPLFRAIKTKRPHIQIIALVAPINSDLARSLDYIDDVMVYRPGDSDLLARLETRQIDASISCYIDSPLGRLLRRAKIPIRIAPATKLAQFYFNHRVTQRRSENAKTEWAYNLDLGQAFFGDLDTRLHPPYIASGHLEKLPRVVLHPGFGGSSDGNIRLDHYLALGRRAASLPGMQVVYTFGPDDHRSYKYIRQHMDFSAELIQSDWSLIEFAQYLAASRLFISTSTGPMHLAGAVNARTLSFFGNSAFASSRRWATISNLERQINIMIGPNYTDNEFAAIETQMVRALA